MRVRLPGGKRSAWAALERGTPQGACWSPLLWSLAIHDLAEHIHGDVVCFADDCSVVISDRDPEKARQRMDAAMAALSSFLRSNHILPSAEKTASP